MWPPRSSAPGSRARRRRCRGSAGRSPMCARPGVADLRAERDVELHAGDVQRAVARSFGGQSHSYGIARRATDPARRPAAAQLAHGAERVTQIHRLDADEAVAARRDARGDLVVGDQLAALSVPGARPAPRLRRRRPSRRVDTSTRLLSGGCTSTVQRRRRREKHLVTRDRGRSGRWIGGVDDDAAVLLRRASRPARARAARGSRRGPAPAVRLEALEEARASPGRSGTSSRSAAAQCTAAAIPSGPSNVEAR